MPIGFERCVKAGGKVRTMKLGGDKYRHICTIKGKRYLGHIKKKKKK
ncbi:unnamed protein product [marine sediment metagenome]|uniref:50S ribosomal protein L36 n=1 Tax=marine sediment metagenome TaxID=412755 RepID=X0ZEH6_9ZZZZ